MAGTTHKHMPNCSIVDYITAKVAKDREVGALVLVQWAETVETLLVAVQTDQELVKLIQASGAICRGKDL